MNSIFWEGKMRSQFLGLVRKIFIPALALLILTVNFSSAEQVARLSVHWSAKHHCAKHAQIFADRVNERAKGKLKIEQLIKLVCENPCDLFGIKNKGFIREGYLSLIHISEPTRPY